MRRAFSSVRRRAVVIAVIAVLLIPITGFANDPQIEPPWPHSVLQPAQPSVLHLLLVIFANSRFVLVS